MSIFWAEWEVEAEARSLTASLLPISARTIDASKLAAAQIPAQILPLTGGLTLATITVSYSPMESHMKRASLLLGMFLMATLLGCSHHTKEVVVEHPDHGGWHDNHHDDHHDWDHH
jgi:hypothetical protein